MAFRLAALPLNYAEGVIGRCGLAGAAGALGARPAGGLADKGKSHLTAAAGLVLLLLAWAAIWFGHISVLALIVGILAGGWSSVMLSTGLWGFFRKKFRRRRKI